jgi:hypothetical protein
MSLWHWCGQIRAIAYSPTSNQVHENESRCFLSLAQVLSVLVGFVLIDLLGNNEENR